LIVAEKTRDIQQYYGYLIQLKITCYPQTVQTVSLGSTHSAHCH